MTTRRRHVASLMLAITCSSIPLVGSTACESTPKSSAEMKALSGSVTYRERMALVPGCTLRLRLVPMTPGYDGAPLAERTIAIEGQVPIAFSIDYDASRIEAGSAWGLDAAIVREGEVLFATPEPVLMQDAEGQVTILRRGG